MKTIITLLTTLVLLGITFFAHASNPINNFLLTAQADVDNATLGEFSSTGMSTLGSLIEDAQFRFNTSTPTNNVDIKKNALSYELRIKPKAWGQRDAEKNILKLRVNQQDLRYKRMLDSALQIRYLRLLDYYQQYHRMQYLLSRSKLLAQQASLYRSQIISEEFDPEKLLDSEEAFKQNQAMIDINLARLHAMQTQLTLPTTTINKLRSHADLNWVINVVTINDKLLASQDDNFDPPEVLDAHLNMQISQSENQLAKIKRQLGVNLLKFEYGDRENDEMAFQVGINIPFGSGFARQENQYKLYNAQAQLSGSVAKIKRSLREVISQITWLSEDWQMIEKQNDRIQKHLRKDYAKTNPFILVNLQKEFIDQKQKQAEINRKALALYVSFLSVSGQLTQSPLRNWIQEGTPQLSLN